MIDILLSTYNGEKYLTEQIESILQQTFTDWHLTVRDDGSKDNTCAIIADYCNRFPTRISKLDDANGNVGVIRSFEILLANAHGDYMMFADQDDFWLPNKVELSYAKMQELEQLKGKNTPILVHTDLLVVDEKLNVINDSFWNYSGIFPDMADENIYYLGIGNTVTGCALIMNAALQKKSLPFPKMVKMHDAWVAICAKKYGELQHISTPTIKYRQHGGNVLGAVKEQKLNDKIRQLKKVWHENKTQYQMTRGIIYPSVFSYIYHKIKYYLKRNV